MYVYTYCSAIYLPFMDRLCGCSALHDNGRLLMNLKQLLISSFITLSIQLPYLGFVASINEVNIILYQVNALYHLR